MLFSGMDEYQFATFFVVIKQEEIKKELDIERLYIDIVIKTLYKFVLKNRKYILDNFKTQYDSLWDKKFFINVVNYLRKYKNTFS